MALAVDQLGRPAPRPFGRGVWPAPGGIRGLRRRSGGARSGALPAAAAVAYRAARRAEPRFAVRCDRGALQPCRRHPGSYVPPYPRRFDRTTWDAPLHRSRRRLARVRIQRHLVGKARRPGAQLQLRHRFDVHLLGQRPHRWRRAHHQQGILQKNRQPLHRPALHLYRRGPVLPRRSAFTAGRAFRRSHHLARRRPRILQAARPRLGAADAHQGPRVGGRARARP